MLTSLAHIAHANGDQAALEAPRPAAPRSSPTSATGGVGSGRPSGWVAWPTCAASTSAPPRCTGRGCAGPRNWRCGRRSARELSWLAWLAVQTRDYAQGRELAERAYALAVEQGSPGALVFAEMSLGLAARRDGKLDLAVTHLSHLADLGRGESQPALYLPMVLVELGYAARAGRRPGCRAGPAHRGVRGRRGDDHDARRGRPPGGDGGGGALPRGGRPTAGRRCRCPDSPRSPPPRRPNATTPTGRPSACEPHSGRSGSTRCSPRARS